MGIAYLTDWLVADDLATGKLTRLLPDYDVPSVTLCAVYTGRRHMLPKLRSFIDFLSASLGSPMALAP